MSLQQTAAASRVDAGRWLDERDQDDARLVRNLAQAGAWDVIDAIYREDAPRLLCGSAPRLRGVAR